jgi:hypothetical protein
MTSQRREFAPRMIRASKVFRAAHEAGHAVIATLLGHEWTHVYIHGTKEEALRNDCWGGLVLVPAEFKMVSGAKNEVLRIMAGIAGAYLYHGKKLPKRLSIIHTLTDGVEGDLTKATKVAQNAFDRIISADCNFFPAAFAPFIEKPNGVDRFIDAMMHEAYSLLENNRELHAHITALLIEKGLVERREVSATRVVMREMAVS